MDDLPRARKGKRLLVAAIGVATVSYASAQSGCITLGETSGNLMAPPPQADAGTPDDGGGQFLDAASGNLLPPPDWHSTPVRSDAGQDAGIISSGNLLPPPPADGGLDAALPGDAGEDAAIIGSGNLLPPPADASTE